MAAGDIFFRWILPGLGLAFFAAGAWANATIMLGLGHHKGDGEAAGPSPSPIPFAPGLIGALAMWNGPFEWMRTFAWAPLLLDAGCLGYLALFAIALLANRKEDSPAAGSPATEAVAAAQEEARKLARVQARYEALAGCLLGTAVGDALGLASEGLSPQRQARMFPQTDRYHLLPFGRGMCSDDTEHTIMVAQSLAETGHHVREDEQARAFRADLAWRMRWWLLGLPAGIGLATLRGILKLWLFLPPRWQGAFSAGNGPAMRSALIGVYWADEPQMMRWHVEASTQLTHSDPKATHAALAVAVAAAMAAQSNGRVEPAAYAARMHEWLGADGAQLQALIERAAASVQAGQSTQGFSASLGLQRGVTGYAFHSVPVALHAWLSHPGDYREAVLAAVRCGGDSDTVAAITGGMAGAGCGRRGLPPQWLGHLVEWPRNVAWMDALALRLAKTRVEFIVPEQPHVSILAVLSRNLFFMAVVLLHGLRRLLPPY